MFCKKCGTALSDNAKFCAKCGTKCGAPLQPAAEIPPAAPMPPPVAPQIPAAYQQVEQAVPETPAVTPAPPAPQSNLCASCGNDLKKSWKACPFCGAVVSGAEAEGQQAAPPPSPAPQAAAEVPPQVQAAFQQPEQARPQTSAEPVVEQQAHPAAPPQPPAALVTEAADKVPEGAEGIYNKIKDELRQERESKKLRHGFTSLYLYIGNIPGYVLAGIGIIEIKDGKSGLLEQHMNTWPSMFGKFIIAIFGGLWILSFWKMGEFKKWGFSLFAAVNIAFSLLDPLGVGVWECLFPSVIGIAILYGVLQFRNAYNAKSTWEQMEGEEIFVAIIKSFIESYKNNKK